MNFKTVTLLLELKINYNKLCISSYYNKYFSIPLVYSIPDLVINNRKNAAFMMQHANLLYTIAAQ